MKSSTKVYLVGSGPSGVELLTLRAADLLGIADVIVYDALVDPRIYKLFNKDAHRVYVGKRAGEHSLTQEQINDLLIGLARERGGQIIRLKGGDPFVFGRGGEEMIALRGAGIDYEVVPGVTAGIAAPAYWGIPVTHRGISRSVTLITAFSKDSGLPDLDWEAYTRLEGTLVFYMGMRVVPTIVEKLISVGLDKDSPAAIISEGTRYTQRIEEHRLSYFTRDRFDYESFTPGVFVVGDVVSFTKTYQWYKPSVLAGKRVLITRSEGQTSELVEKFEELGAIPDLLPIFEIEQVVPDCRCVLKAEDNEERLLAFTSPNGVHSYIHYINALGKDVRFLASFKAVAVVGPGTAKALASYGISADLTAGVHTAEGLAREIIEKYPDVESIVNPTSDIGGATLSEELRKHRVETETLVVYRNKPLVYDCDELRRLLSDNLSWVTFCSSSAVTNFIALLQDKGLLDLLSELKIASIGPSTSKTLRSYNYEPSVQPDNPSLDALVEAMEAYDSEQG